MNAFPKNDDEEDGEDNGLDNASKMKAMKAIMNFADDQENGDMMAKVPKAEPSRESEGGLSDPDFMKDGETGADEKKKKGGGMGGMDLSSIMGMFGK